ncbi:hypothetical protein ACQ1Q1_00060 [Ornithobacterium rhinotracheale]|uniref:Uncharacterized protein n=1 Tax=Ornithobacterium rhinotracheale (strain ATCC 51463 / DSM 15997 / CCUG 23171 / CIP 104009 / LMG 9086) TaxID=867902 RepID=I3ZY06_ORNRL|nr:hypothetical protein [Ornithobacterium rhinotracheale]AFL96590.1 hypothetical protein Ornrh_0383 [Ornithobacterium rhinotracheale DSM 15997]MCK0194914.1 hypothetical protein [Ornithobacterium rhinotracheale]MCK0203278.1 hypothetical protein [Ornithobacterium rhinotracheale]MCK0204360.1 hypothetical protein [Ornithobacterium rhinotracheale]UOH62847.1 hypothetical protein MT993_07435 [Ornithobacterium rhinotracheale]
MTKQETAPMFGGVATVIITTVTLYNDEQTQILTAINPKYFSFEEFYREIKTTLNNYPQQWKKYKTVIYHKEGNILKKFTEYATITNSEFIKLN